MDGCFDRNLLANKLRINMSSLMEEADAKYKKRDDASARLAEKMLQV